MATFTQHEVQHHRTERGVEGVPGGNVPASSSWTAVIVISVLAVAAIGRFLAHGMDRNRISAYAQGNGWQLLDCRWRFFGPGWIGNRNARFYDIRYRDADGRTHTACAKTSALAGVYLTDDRVEG